MSEKMRVIIFQQADKWIAQGIEHDICTQGESPEEAMERFALTIQLEDKEDGGVKRIATAPEYFKEMWETHSNDDFKNETDSCIDYRIAA